MVVNFRLTADDLYQGQRRALQKTKFLGSRRLPRSFPRVFALVFIGIGVFLLTTRDANDNRGAAIAAIGLGLFFLFFDLFLWRILATRYFKRNPSLQKEYRGQLDEDGVKYWAQDMHSKSGWSTFVRWQESKDLILLYPATGIFNMLPKRSFSPTEVDPLRELVARKIGKV